MTARPGPVPRAHRLLAPRIAYLIGTRSPRGEANLIPVSNVTSVSIDPQLVLLAVHRAWQTFENLREAGGFTLSVPRSDQRHSVWKLGARYSRYDYPDRTAKLRDCGLPLADRPYLPGPVLLDGLGWLTCNVIHRPDYGGDHGIFIGQVTHVEFSEAEFTEDGTPAGDLHPVMQVTGNTFTTADGSIQLPYGE